MSTLEELEAELRTVHAERDRQYWCFTRQARARPVDPGLCRRQVGLERQIREMRWPRR